MDTGPPIIVRGALALAAALLLGGPGTAAAEIGGYAEYNYSLLHAESTDPGGTIRTRSSVLNQRYNLTMDKDILPTLRFIGGASFEKNDADSTTDRVDSSSSATRIYPTADLSYSNGVFSGGLGFSRRQESSSSNGLSSPAIFFDSYNSRFGWKPEGLPSLDVIYSIFDTYDEHHAAQDGTSSSLTVGSRFKPLESLDMSYQANYTSLTNHLAGFESRTLNQNLRLAYSDAFFTDRVSVSTSYNVATQETTTQNRGAAPVALPPTLRSIDQLFLATTPVTADPFTTPSFAGFNNPYTTSTLAGTAILGNGLTDIRYNIGLRSNFSAVNILRLLVAVNAPNHTVTPADYADIAGAFGLNDPQNSGIRIYRSAPQDGTNWVRVPATIIFGQLTNPSTGALSDGFEITLAEPVPAGTFLKVEVETVRTETTANPFIRGIALSAAEVFLREAAPLPAGRSVSTSQLSGIYNLNLKAKLLDLPLLYYDFGFNLDHTSSDTQDLTYRYILINGLSLNHRFSQTLSTNARLAREDAEDPLLASRSANIASISLSAQPLPTLTQSANYSFRQESEGSLTRTTHSVNVSNSAELYRGISLSLTAGGSLLGDSTGADQKSMTVTGGLNLIPHRTLTVNLTVSDSRTWTAGPGKPEESLYSQTADMSINYNPLPGIYLFASGTLNAQKNRKTQTAQSIGGSWSPFRGGALLLNTSYRENIDSSGNKDRTAVQSLRWNIRAGWFLDVSYLFTMNSSPARKMDTQAFSTSLRMSF